MAASIELNVDRTLLNPNFEGYKLSRDKLPVYRTNIECGKYISGKSSYSGLTSFGLKMEFLKLKAVTMIQMMRKAPRHVMRFW